ncbi:hypothetical protein NDU88_005656 [Pleurodeles waltl]|uniref:Uncharacterized protein n=1 Tax=Pleurodeles waltl TaxID=8319 RepID=A0AAV7MBV5_PLEWA|nr:hypothetical protein NDU88_005656 [Pleurodeles waltl]
MAPKNPPGTRGKPGAGATEGRQPLSLGAASNDGRRLISKLQGAHLRKRPDQLEDSILESGYRGDLQPGDGPVIPDIFKAPQQGKRLMAPAGKGATSSTTSSQQNWPQDSTVVQSELDAKPSHVSDNIIVVLEDSAVAGISDVAFKSNFETSVPVRGCRVHTPHSGAQNTSENVSPPQHSEGMRHNGEVALAQQHNGEGQRIYGGSHEAIIDTRPSKGFEPGQGEDAENFFSINPGRWKTISTELDSSISTTTSKVGLSETASKKGSKKAEFGKRERDTAGKKKKKSARGTRAMSWDYYATQQLHYNVDVPSKDSTDLVPGPVELLENPSLHLIYQTMMLQHKQTQSGMQEGQDC